jgi:hypothetical protein
MCKLRQQNPQQLPYPYFQINLLTVVPLIQTEEGISAYPDGKCDLLGGKQ